MKNFADRLLASIKKNNSFIVAGFDPQLETFPEFLLKESTAADDETSVLNALVRFHELALEALAGTIAAVKPNIAFFEQYGLAGLKAFARVCATIKEHRLPVIADVKRGDIGSTAKAYSAAYLGRNKFQGRSIPAFDVDAITINPYLGFDTVETYFDDCVAYGKGLFVLVKTSNPGSAALQNLKGRDSSRSVCEEVAVWLGEKAELLKGDSGYSSLGAVVGATYPAEAKALRTLMPRNFLLIPGMGAQGGSAEDAVAGFSDEKSGGIINISRGLLGGLSGKVHSAGEMKELIRSRADEFNGQIAAALA